MPLLFFDLISLKSSRESQFFAKSVTGKLKLIFDVSKFLSGSNNYGLLAPMVKIGYLSFLITKNFFAV